MTRHVIVCLFLVSLVGAAARGGATLDAQEMDGTWKPVAAELAGEQWPKQVLDSMKLILKDDKYTVQVGEQSDNGEVKRDPSKSPKTMDIKGTKGPNEGKTFLVIYELKGDELRVCYDLSGKSRPTEFATKPATQLFLVTYRRANPELIGRAAMTSAKKLRVLGWGLLLAVASVAPVPQGQEARKQPPLAEARYNAALKQCDLIWSYFKQNRVESFDVYVWSRLLLDATKGVSGRPDKQIAGFEGHLDRMTRLESLVKKVRRLGFGRSSDVGASEYYRIEAECWLAEAKLR